MLDLSKEGVFYQVYENLELDLLTITDYICLSDDNSPVYCVKLSTFILSCNTEWSTWNGRVTFNSQIFDLKTVEIAPLLYGVLSSQEPTDKIDQYLKSCSVVRWYDFDSMISEGVHRGLVKSFGHLINYHIPSIDQDKVLENGSNPELVFYSLKNCIDNHLFLSIHK